MTLPQKGSSGLALAFRRAVSGREKLRPWGEDFHGDEALSLFSARRFDELSFDEQVRFHPRLRLWPDDEDVLRALLAKALAVLDEPGAPSRGVLPFERREALADLLRTCVHGRYSAAQPAPEDAIAFAYFVSIHPAHLWPQFACAAGELTMAGWLGWIDRGRSAYVPLEVADALSLRSGEPAQTGRPIGAEILFRHRRPSSGLLDAAARRLRGEVVCVAAAPPTAPRFVYRRLAAAFAWATP